MSDRYFLALDEILARVREANRDSIADAAAIVADTIAADGIVHAFGSGHSQLLAIELAGRAGGLAGIQVILDPGQGKAETLEGYAATIVRDYAFEPRDCLIVISNSGRNPSPIEMAMMGREHGMKVIAVTAADFSRSVSSRHSSGRRLLDLADVVLDTRGAAGDAAVHIEGAPADVGPTSTVVGAALLNAVMAEAVAELVRRGVPPPILVSQNTDNFAEHNEALRRRYAGRIRSVT
ncbi:MAG TPA: sugar isomerase domain-containing protein [Candidatus Limnocylindria bacterium]